MTTPEPDHGANRFQLGDFGLTVPTSFGPRLLGLSFGDGPGLFASLDDRVALEGGPSGPYHLRGGHRLWAAPEVPGITYASDDAPCSVEESAAWLTVEGSVDAAGFRKSLSVELSNDGLVVDHELHNESDQTREVAPWAITQLPLGGVAICPVVGEATPFDANRSLVIWPYTDLADRRIGWLPSAVTLSGEPGPQIKVGSGPAPGRIGYLREGQLFQKEIPSAGDGPYPDRGAIGQVYVNEHFLELESVGPLRRLEPGEFAAHREVWTVAPCHDLEDAYERIMEDN